MGLKKSFEAANWKRPGPQENAGATGERVTVGKCTDPLQFGSSTLRSSDSNAKTIAGECVAQTIPASVGLWIAQAVTPARVAPGTSGLSLAVTAVPGSEDAGRALAVRCVVDLRCYSTSQSVPVTLTPAPDSVRLRPLNAFTVVPSII